MKKNVIIVILGTIVIALVAVLVLKKDGAVSVNSFEECVAAGNAVMESHPRQCKAGGKTFVEDIGNANAKVDLIRANTPKPNEKIHSPLVVTGEARGTWYFEASFPVKLYDEEGNLLASGPATATEDWMTEDFVPFTATLEFSAPSKGTTGKLVLEKDNPSGLPENDDSLIIPVKF